MTPRNPLWPHALIFVGFWRNPDIPTTYVLSLSIVWAAMRFSPLTTGLQCLSTGAGAVVMTIAGYGPIAQVNADETRALVAQTFVVVLMVTGLTIALIRLHTNETIERLQESEEALEVRADELGIVLSHLREGVAINEKTGKVVHANPAMHSMFEPCGSEGNDRTQEPNAQAIALLHPDGALVAPENRPFARAFRGDVVIAEEFNSRNRNGSVHVLEISAFPIPGPRDAPPRVQEVIRDVTTAAMYRESLVFFAGSVAHDLNGPLTVIDRGEGGAIGGETSSSTATEAAHLPMVHQIRGSTDKAKTSISSLLARSISRDQSLTCEFVDLNGRVQDITDSRAQGAGRGESIARDLVGV